MNTTSDEYNVILVNGLIISIRSLHASHFESTAHIYLTGSIILIHSIHLDLGEVDALNGRVGNKPENGSGSDLVDNGRGKSGLGLLEDLLEDRGLSGSLGDESDGLGSLENGESDGDSSRRRLGRVLNGGDKLGLLLEQSVSREQRASVAIRTASEQNEIENRHSLAVERHILDNLLLVVLGDGIRVVQKRLLDGEDLWLLILGDVIEQILLEETVVGVGIVQLDQPFVGEENLPLGELGLRVVDQTLSESRHQRASRYGNMESSSGSN
jgi:hypothetical protein